MKKKTDIKTRILKRIKIDDNDCWLLPASKKNNGYSKMRINGVNKRAHKVSWEVFVGPVPKGLLVLHHCDVRHCVNPAHLWLGTPKDNYDDMLRKNRGRNNIKKTVLNQIDVRGILDYFKKYFRFTVCPCMGWVICNLG